MELKIERTPEYVLVVLPHAIGVDDYLKVEKTICSQLSEGDQVVLDLRETENLYSTGIGVIVRLRKRILELDGTICLVNVNKRCRYLLDSVHLGKVMTVYATDVEFEISHDKGWERATRKLGDNFLCIARIENGVCRATLSGNMMSRADLASFDAITNLQSEVFVFDLTGLDSVDSVGAQKISLLLKDLAARNARCSGYGAAPEIADLLHYLCLEEYLPLYDNEREALESV